MRCPYCGNNAIWCDNKVIYGRNIGRSYKIWLCRQCEAYVGCHKNSKKPLGILAGKALREARVETHRVVDKLWKNGYMTRTQVYNMLRNNFSTPGKGLGRPIHIGWCDLNMCHKIMDYVNGLDMRKLKNK